MKNGFTCFRDIEQQNFRASLNKELALKRCMWSSHIPHSSLLIRESPALSRGRSDKVFLSSLSLKVMREEDKEKRQDEIFLTNRMGYVLLELPLCGGTNEVHPFWQDPG